MWQKTSRFNSQRGTLLICIILIDIKNTINSYRNNDSPNSRADQIEKGLKHRHTMYQRPRYNGHFSCNSGHFGKTWRPFWASITIVFGEKQLFSFYNGRFGHDFSINGHFGMFKMTVDQNRKITVVLVSNKSHFSVKQRSFWWPFNLTVEFGENCHLRFLRKSHELSSIPWKLYS